MDSLADILMQCRTCCLRMSLCIHPDAYCNSISPCQSRNRSHVVIPAIIWRESIIFTSLGEGTLPLPQ